jgi:hypothetical protein
VRPTMKEGGGKVNSSNKVKESDEGDDRDEGEVVDGKCERPTARHIRLSGTRAARPSPALSGTDPNLYHCPFPFPCCCPRVCPAPPAASASASGVHAVVPVVATRSGTTSVNRATRSHRPGTGTGIGTGTGTGEGARSPRNSSLARKAAPSSAFLSLSGSWFYASL